MNGGFRMFQTTRTRVGAGLLIAATGALLTPAIASGSTALSIKINTTTHTWPLSHRQPGKAVTLPAGCGA
jgi:hypothetical protein